MLIKLKLEKQVQKQRSEGMYSGRETTHTKFNGRKESALLRSCKANMAEVQRIH